MSILHYLSEALLLVVALSLDSFVASFAYGSNKIKIPIPSALIISLIGSIFLGVSLSLGAFIQTIIPSSVTAYFCFILLLILGMIKIYDSSMKALIRKSAHQPISFSTKQITLILQVYATPTKADYDGSSTLSAKEALFLAIALSLDSLAAGLGSPSHSISAFEMIGFAFVVNLVMIGLGNLFGKKVSERLELDLSWLSGLLLIILAILKIV